MVRAARKAKPRGAQGPGRGRPINFVSSINGSVIQARCFAGMSIRKKGGPQVQMPLNGLARADVENIKRQSFDFGPP
jgi:hypothetical protein